MKIFRGNDLADVSGNKAISRAVALGNFDGLHLGHKKLIDELKKKALELNAIPTVVTFEPHPLKLFKPDLKNYRLTTFDEKNSLLKQYGIEEVFVMDFTAEFAKISADDFVNDFIVKALHTKFLITGEDFHFGFKRQGNPALLQAAADKNGFIYTEMNAVKDEGSTRYSSSQIRLNLLDGNVKTANTLLGHNFFISGEVIQGLQNGRTIGFPTANLAFIEDKIIPQYGVYSSSTEVDGKHYKSITNIGVKPTVNGKEPLCETHIFDFDGNLYGKHIKVELEKFIRKEQKFNSLDELKEQIKKDIAGANE